MRSTFGNLQHWGCFGNIKKLGGHFGNSLSLLLLHLFQCFDLFNPIHNLPEPLQLYLTESRLP